MTTFQRLSEGGWSRCRLASGGIQCLPSMEPFFPVSARSGGPLVTEVVGGMGSCWVTQADTLCSYGGKKD